MRKLAIGITLAITIVLIAGPVFVHAADAKEGLVKCGRDKDPQTGVIKDPCGFVDIITGIKTVVNFLIVLGVAIAAIFFAWAGFLYMTAAGNMHKVEEAHHIFGSVFIGFVIMLSAWLIVSTIEKTLLSRQRGSDGKSQLERSYLRNPGQSVEDSVNRALGPR